MKLKYVIPIVTNPYNGNMDNEKICVYEEDAADNMKCEDIIITAVNTSHRMICEGKDIVTNDSYIVISPMFYTFSKEAQRFMLMVTIAKRCFKAALCNDDLYQCGIDVNAPGMPTMADIEQRVVTVHTLHRMITLYGTRTMDSVVDELYHSRSHAIGSSARQDYKDIINMYIYGMPRDVLDLGAKISSINNAKFNLDDIDIMFVCRDGKFDIATMKCERF